MADIEYAYYYSDYNCGRTGKIPDSEFSFYAEKAQSFLKALCHTDIDEVCANDMKQAVCEIADVFYGSAMRDGISSKSNDGYSVSYEESSAEERAKKIALRRLGASGAMYMGVE